MNRWTTEHTERGDDVAKRNQGLVDAPSLLQSQSSVAGCICSFTEHQTETTQCSNPYVAHMSSMEISSPRDNNPPQQMFMFKTGSLNKRTRLALSLSLSLCLKMHNNNNNNNNKRNNYNIK